MEQPIDKLFWGLVVVQGKEYKQTPKYNFHVSMAVLDLKTADNEAVAVNVQVENSEFILCNLTKNQPQMNLDLIFSEGEKIKFFTSGGKANVHLTGYLMPEDDLGAFEDEEFSDEESVDLELMERLAAGKRKATETLKLTGKDAKKLKASDGKAVDAKALAQQGKIVDVDPKQLLAAKKQDNKPEQPKKTPQAAAAVAQQQTKKQQQAKLATKDLEVDSESDDDLSVDEDEESVDLNKLNELMDDDSDGLDDDDLESDDDDLESDDEDVAKLNQIKGKLNKQPQQGGAKPQVASAQKGKQNDKPHQQGAKPYQQKQQQNGGQFNKQHQHNKSPQQHQNKSNQNTPFNKGQQGQKHTPFNKGQQHNNSGKKNTPFQHNKNKSFGSQNKGKKVFT